MGGRGGPPNAGPYYIYILLSFSGSWNPWIHLASPDSMLSSWRWWSHFEVADLQGVLKHRVGLRKKRGVKIHQQKDGDKVSIVRGNHLQLAMFYVWLPLRVSQRTMWRSESWGFTWKSLGFMWSQRKIRGISKALIHGWICGVLSSQRPLQQRYIGDLWILGVPLVGWTLESPHQQPLETCNHHSLQGSCWIRVQS